MKLLPRPFNVAAICWIAVWIVCRITIPFIIKSPVSWPNWILIINAVALGVACFSSEKTEDEMIRSLRLESVAIVAGLFLLLYIILIILGLAGISGKLSDYINTLVYEDPSIWILLYLIVFKTRNVLISRRMTDD